MYSYSYYSYHSPKDYHNDMRVRRGPWGKQCMFPDLSGVAWKVVQNTINRCFSSSKCLSLITPCNIPVRLILVSFPRSSKRSQNSERVTLLMAHELWSSPRPGSCFSGWDPHTETAAVLAGGRAGALSQARGAIQVYCFWEGVWHYASGVVGGNCKLLDPSGVGSRHLSAFLSDDNCWHYLTHYLFRSLFEVSTCVGLFNPSQQGLPWWSSG